MIVTEFTYSCNIYLKVYSSLTTLKLLNMLVNICYHCLIVSFMPLYRGIYFHYF